MQPSSDQSGVGDLVVEYRLLLGRVRRLERTHGVFGGVALLAVVLVVVLGARAADPEKLDVRELTIRDGGGVVRATLGVDVAGATRLDLSDPQGRRRVGLAVDPEGLIGIDLVDPLGVNRMVLGSRADGRVSLTMFDQDGGLKGSVGLGIEADRTVGLTILGADGRNLRAMSRPAGEVAFTAFRADLSHYATLGFGKDGGMNLSLRKEGRPIIQAVSTDGGDGYLAAHDREGVARMEVGAGPQGAFGTYLRNAKGEARCILDLDPEGRPRLLRWDLDGNALPEAR